MRYGTYYFSNKYLRRLVVFIKRNRSVCRIKLGLFLYTPHYVVLKAVKSGCCDLNILFEYTRCVVEISGIVYNFIRQMAPLLCRLLVASPRSLHSKNRLPLNMCVWGVANCNWIDSASFIQPSTCGVFVQLWRIQANYIQRYLFSTSRLDFILYTVTVRVLFKLLFTDKESDDIIEEWSWRLKLNIQ